MDIFRLILFEIIGIIYLYNYTRPAELALAFNELFFFFFYNGGKILID